MADRIGQQLGNYQIVSLLGQGGFAEVYLGEHVYLRTRAAIKVLQAQLAKDDMEGFLTEARTIANLVHPNIVRVLEFGLEGNTPFLVMDYAPNGSLRQLHPKGIVLPLATITSYVRQVAAALQYAHNQRLVHRDIKPENMLVGRQHEILLSDFGIALIAQSSRYESNQDIAGTVAYMSPEQIQGKPRPASDQYSLGVVVYEWLSGNRPFHGSFTELCTQHMFASPPSLREKVPTISSAIEQVVMTALAKDPKERFMSVQAFANALEQASKSAKVPLVEARPDRLPTSSPSPQPGPIMSPPAPSRDSEQDIATTPERNILTELEQNIPATLLASPEQAVVSLPPSPIPPTERAAPFSPTPASTPQPAIILPAVAPPKQEDYAPRRSDTPPSAPQPEPRPNYYRLIIPIAIVLVLVLGSVLVAPTLFKGSQTILSPTATTPTTPATVHTNATATATPLLSALTPQQLYTRVTSGQPTLSDPLSAPDQNQWDQNTACAFTNGRYQITNNSTTQYLPCMARNTNFANFAYQVQMTFLIGNPSGGGLIFRSSHDVTTFYRFSLDNQGAYKLFICQCANTNNGGGTRLTQANIANTAHVNTLTVITNGQSIYLYINGTLVFRGSDATASAGEIGLYGFSSSRVAFSNLKVWALP